MNTKKAKAYKLYTHSSDIFNVKEIADTVGVSRSTIYRWVRAGEWKRSLISDESKRNDKCIEIMNNNGLDIDDGLSHAIDIVEEYQIPFKQVLFCYHYVRSYNATTSYMKSYNCSYESAMTQGSRMLRIVKVQELIKELKSQKLMSLMISEEDVVQKHIDIAFSDICDFFEQVDTSNEVVTGGEQNIRLKSLSKVDGSIVKELRIENDKVHIKLMDRYASLIWLGKYFGGISQEERLKIKELEQKVSVRNSERDTESGVVILPERTVGKENERHELDTSVNE